MISKKSVPFFNYQSLFGQNEHAFTEIFMSVGRRGAFIQQEDLRIFEERIAAYLEAGYVLGMANATDALHLALRAAGIGPGDEVIFCSHTMVATAAAIHFAGGTPVPIECGGDHLMDPTAIEPAITPLTKAILPTHLNGRTCEMDAITSIAAKYGLRIIEDSAQALGSRHNGRYAGTFGDAGCVSFYPAKTLGCFGDGGCVITNDEAMYEKLRQMRDHGRDETGEVQCWGLNSRLDNLQAAFLNVKLNTYSYEIERRREVAALYNERLRKINELRLPPPPDADSRHFDIYQNYEIEADCRDALRRHLSEMGVGTLIQWGGKAVHQWGALGFHQSLPRTEELFAKLLMLPMNTLISNEDVGYVCDCIETFYAVESATSLK